MSRLADSFLFCPFLPFLWIGVITPYFRTFGTTPSCMHLLYSLDNIGAINEAQCFITTMGISLDLLLLNSFIIFSISS